MRNLTLTIAGICLYFFASSQAGIHFERGLSWQQVQQKAKKQHKFIFIDCYTTWCGPCKYMARNVFPLKETGDALNSRFISVGMQLDSTAHDSDTVKRAYTDAHLIGTAYQVKAYPTYLFFSPAGKLVHRAVGSTDASHFITYAKDALDPGKQYYTMVKRYREGIRDTLLLEALGQQALANGDNPLADSALKAWFEAIQDPYTKDRLEIIARITKKPDDPGFDLFYRNAAKIDGIERPDFAETVVMNIIIQKNQTIMNLFADSTAVPDWGGIARGISNAYSADYAKRIVTWVKVPYYKMKKDYGHYGPSLISYLKEYGEHLEGVQLNNYAWDIFQYCSSSDDLAFGLSCSSRTLAGLDKPNPGFMDTYANLLYKSGRTADAIAKETEAVSLTDGAGRKPYQETLDKMKAGEKTWD